MTIQTINNRDLNTGKEIATQPAVWKMVYDLLVKEKKSIDNFLTPVFSKENLRIVLSGAGSSAFLGQAAQLVVEKATKRVTQAIPTTDLVTHPEFLNAHESPILLVSFARSGNSPESLESIALADRYCKELHHLIITCNKDGELAQYANTSKSNCFCLVLPEDTHDQSLAMTGSFTSMLLSILLIAEIATIEEKANYLEQIIALGQQVLESKESFTQLATKDFDRVVFLGSGELLGIARECSLKLQELTDGQVICKHDSFLGLRHGPRAVVTTSTLMVYLFSPNAHVMQYEYDLAKGIAADPRNIQSISIGNIQDIDLTNTTKIPLKLDATNNLNCIPLTLIGQLLGYYTSLHLGLDPDNPSVSGAISRVVKGVKIYKLPEE